MNRGIMAPRGGSHHRRALREPRRREGYLSVLAGLIIVAMIGGAGWLAWETAGTESALARARMDGERLSEIQRGLMARRGQMASRENILPRASAMGLYPPRPEQVRGGNW